MPMNTFFFKKRSLFFFLALSLLGLCLRCGGGGGPGTVNNSSGITPVASEGCGDAEIDPGEGCDDGNWENSDGCNARCGLEVGEAICGNGIKENGECCDDGNTNDGDGCSSTCTLESANQPPSAPVLAVQPADGATWAPTRLYLSWSASSDPDAGDSVVYDVYFVEGNGIPSNAVPYKGSITDTNFIIQASTDNRSKYFPDQVAPIYLEPLQTYTWMVCARDNQGATACSPTRTFNTDDSVVGWWRFDENPAGSVCPAILGGPAGGAGETVCDYSGKGNHGVPSGGPTWLPSASDILGRALDFDGVNDKVEVQNDPTLDVGATMTLSCRIKPQVPITDAIILNKDSPLSGPYIMSISATNRINFTMFIAGMFKTTVGDITGFLGSYLRPTGIYDGAKMQLYFNNTLQDSVASPGTITNNTNLLKFSFNPVDSSYYHGQTDECLKINKALNASELANIVNSDN